MKADRTLARQDFLAVLRRASLLVGEPPELPHLITGVSDDSRTVVPGGVFFAIRGHDANGRDYIDGAVRRGACAVVVEPSDLPHGNVATTAEVPVVCVSDSRAAAAVVAAEFYGQPAFALRLVGVTGTNGKSTTVHMVRALLCDTGMPAASIGTLGVLTGRDGTPIPGGQGLTTPGPVEMQRVLRELLGRGTVAVAMEVSSHALAQQRVAGIAFDVAVYTSFSRDHLDYHGSMESYFEAKARLLAFLKPNGVAVINAQEPAWANLPRARRVVGFSARSSESTPTTLRPDASIESDEIRFDAQGSRFTLRARNGADKAREAAARLPLLGDFNILNATGAIGAAWSLGQPLEALAVALATLPQVPGRLERLHAHPTVLRDYAHTPDALDRALRAVRPFARSATGQPARVHVVFGCGGDRDRGKRPEMGAIAERLADVVVLTSDNPRTEDPERILDDIEAGMTSATRQPPHARIEDRRAAIAHALSTADPSDVILLAGKGHETYQIRGTEKRPFDEAVIVAELVS